MAHPTSRPAGTSASITHIVELDDRNKDYFANNTSTFETMRVTIHDMGLQPNGIYNNNHVSILLILIGEPGAVQLDMRTDLINDDYRGQLHWKRVYYEHSNSETCFRDYQLGVPVQVKTLYNAIRNQWGFHRYNFFRGGSGCHFWNYALLSRMRITGSTFQLQVSVPEDVWEFFSCWYSRSGVLRSHVPMRKGKFLSLQEWRHEWFE